MNNHKVKCANFEISNDKPFTLIAGPCQLENEAHAIKISTELKKITSEIKNPISCIIGGSKISTKIGMIKNLIPKFDNIIIVGGMANNILSFKGNQIGKSIKENNCESIIDDIFKTAQNHSCSIIFPEDVKSVPDATVTVVAELEMSPFNVDVAPL